MFSKLLMILLFSSVCAKGTIYDAADKYASALYETHPNLALDKETATALEMFKVSLKKINPGFFFIDKKESNSLKKKKNAVDDVLFKNTLKEFKNLAANDQEGAFLIAMIGSSPPLTYDQIFLYRYMKHISPKFKKQAEEKNHQNLMAIYKIYKQKKTAIKKVPSFADLALPEELLFYVNSKGEKLNWIYTADSKSLKSAPPIPVVAIPVPRSSGKADCIRDNGTLSAAFNFKTLKDANTNTTSLSAVAQGKTVISLTYLEVIRLSALNILKRHSIYAAHESYAKATNNSIKQLLFKKGEEKFPSADGSKMYEWLYLGATHKVVSQGKRIICITNSPVSGKNHIGFFGDGSHIEVSPEQFEVILAKGL